MFAGKPPYTGANHMQLLQNIQRGEGARLPSAIAAFLSPPCKEVTGKRIAVRDGEGDCSACLFYNEGARLLDAITAVTGVALCCRRRWRELLQVECSAAGALRSGVLTLKSCCKQMRPGMLTRCADGAELGLLHMRSALLTLESSAPMDEARMFTRLGSAW
eukprot:1139107-Pelagomonas_calceolata.AAC.4